MFPSSLSQGRLESVWEVLDQVAGSGNITDTRLVSREAGIQFTLDLGNHELNIEALKTNSPMLKYRLWKRIGYGSTGQTNSQG